MKKLIVLFLSLFMISTSVNAAEIPLESLPSNAPFDCMEYTESLISDILDKVQSGLGFSNAQAEARRRFFALVVSGQSNGYSFSQLSEIASNAIFQYRDMYLRPDFYANNLEKVRAIITPVIEEYKSGKITYAYAEFNARNMIYQSLKPDFNPDVEYTKDPLSRDIPPVDNSLFILARKLILESK